MAVVIEESQAVRGDCLQCLTCSVVVKEPYIRCFDCQGGNIVCLQCFARGLESQSHKNNHSYEIVRTNFSVLEESWNASEELCLLEAIADCGFGNCESGVDGNIVCMKTSHQELELGFHKVKRGCKVSLFISACEHHYMKCFVDQPSPPLRLPELDTRLGSCSPSENISPICFKASEDPPRPLADSARSAEIAGYMPCRGDFDMEYDNYAELDIKDIDFDLCESELLQKLQFAAVEIYMSRLRQRFYRKQIVRKYGLINIKKWQMAERRHSKPEKELRDYLRPFARLHSPEQHEMLVQALLMERFLKTEIVALQEYREAGVKTKKGAEIYERLKKNREEERGKRRALDDVLAHLQDQRACQAWLQRQASLESGQRLAPMAMPSLGRKPAARLDISGTPGVELLSSDERELCSTLRLLPNDYLNYKATLIKENDKQGFLRLAQARTLVRIDVNKTRKMYNFFIGRGWVVKPDD